LSNKVCVKDNRVFWLKADAFSKCCAITIERIAMPAVTAATPV
jgi:hypothetical protein